MKEIIFFSNNKNKIQEISSLFIKFNYKLLSLNDYKNTVSPIESGKTFKDNAKIKSIYGFKKFNKICFADDSGICIDALNGGPGINSKTYLEQLGNGKSKDKALLDFETEGRIEVRKNSEWLADFDMEKIIDLLSKSTVGQMLAKDEFSKRYESGVAIALHEFLYPIFNYK